MLSILNSNQPVAWAFVPVSGVILFLGSWALNLVQWTSWPALGAVCVAAWLIHRIHADSGMRTRPGSIPSWGLGAACNPHDWHGVGLDMVGFPLLFSRHATRDAIERWRPKARDLHVYRYVVVCRGFDRGISVASVAVLAHVLVFCSSARRRGIGGRLARIGGTGFDYRRCDLDHGRGAEGCFGDGGLRRIRPC